MTIQRSCERRLSEGRMPLVPEAAAALVAWRAAMDIVHPLRRGLRRSRLLGEPAATIGQADTIRPILDQAEQFET